MYFSNTFLLLFSTSDDNVTIKHETKCGNELIVSFIVSFNPRPNSDSEPEISSDKSTLFYCATNINEIECIDVTMDT